MMVEVGALNFNGHNLTWFQARAHQFAVQPKLPAEWNRISLNRVGPRSREIMKNGGTWLWSTNLPIDLSRPWDLRGSFLFFEILRLQTGICGEFVQSTGFKNYLHQKQADLVIIDHFIQECFVATSSLLNTTSVMFSNWPIADGYISAINVPANPSVVPKTGKFFSSLYMSFFDRVRNTIFHWLIAVARQIHAYFINYYYDQWGYPNVRGDVDLDKVQANHLLYAGRFEFLAEPIRPLTNRLKHFGCAGCQKKSNYEIRRPSLSISSSSTSSNLYNSSSPNLNQSYSKSSELRPIVLELNQSGALAVSHQTKAIVCSQGCLIHRTRVSNKTTGGSLTPIEKTHLRTLLREAHLIGVEERYIKTQLEFEALDLRLLDNGPFVLVSFGSVAQTRFMPAELLDTFLYTFRKLAPLRFVWQTNSNIHELLGERTVPDNLILVQWAPIKILLAHQNLHYAILHGGVNTLNELLFFGVPVLGVPLQGDQPSNVQRLCELGMADLMTIRELYEPNFFIEKLREFDRKLPGMRKRARIVSNMIATYRQLNGEAQHFWLHWAQRHGKQLQSTASDGHKRNYFERELRTSFDYFCVKEIGLWSTLVLFLLLLISQ